MISTAETYAAARVAAPHDAAPPRPSSQQTALGFEGVTKRYGREAPALDTVTWSLRRGARACLLGPNGAGKSTSIRLLQGALQPTVGRVTLLETPVDSAAYLEARRRTGIVPQSPGMFRDLSVGEYLALARRLYGRGEIATILERFALGPYRTTMLGQLSGGYQRRVSLAAALLAEPELLLLDEPTVGLDPVAAHEVHAALRTAMAAPGRTTLLCTHNLAEAEALCDEVVILSRGKVLLHAPIAELRRRARPHLRLAARQGATAELAALARQGLAGRAADGPKARPASVLVPLVHPDYEAPALLRALLADGLDVYACEPVEATLEELFMDAVVGAH
jgi:ABC-2 type transport system ATP-binding protein